MEGVTLAELGEFWLINNIVKPTLAKISRPNGLGDDCASLPFTADHDLVVTCDRAPTPLPWNQFANRYWMQGWFAVLTNASDLAAAGACPLAFLSSVEAPESMAPQDLKAFFSGVASFAQEYGFLNAGGNLGSGPDLSCHGTALGLVPKGEMFTRRGCRPGHEVWIVGNPGLFIAAYLKARRLGVPSLSGTERSLLLKPRPKIREMGILRDAGLVSAATDDSDSLLGAFWNLAEASSCALKIDMVEEHIPTAVRLEAEAAGVDPWNLMFFWGGWNVAITIPPEYHEKISVIAAANGFPIVSLGEVVPGKPQILGVSNNQTRELSVLRNEGFLQNSFGTGIEGHLDYLLKTPLFA